MKRLESMTFSLFKLREYKIETTSEDLLNKIKVIAVTISLSRLL